MFRKFFIVSVVALTTLGASLTTFADPEQPAPGGPGEGRPKHARQAMRWDPAKREEMRKKHQQALHDRLKLTAEQEPAWQKFIESTKPPERPKRPEGPPPQVSAPERLEKAIERSKEHTARMENHLSALKEFYGQLTPEQQKIMDHPFGDRPHHRGPKGGAKIQAPPK